MASATRGYWFAFDEVDNQGQIIKLGRVEYTGGAATIPYTYKANGGKEYTGHRGVRDAEELRAHKQAKEDSRTEARRLNVGAPAGGTPVALSLIARVWPVEAADFWPVSRDPSYMKCLQTLAEMTNAGTFTPATPALHVRCCGGEAREFLAKIAESAVWQKAEAEKAQALAAVQVAEGLAAWRENRCYVDNAGNYRVLADGAQVTTHSRGGKVAPWSKALKAAYPEGTVGFERVAAEPAPEPQSQAFTVRRVHAREWAVVAPSSEVVYAMGTRRRALAAAVFETGRTARGELSAWVAPEPQAEVVTVAAPASQETPARKATPRRRQRRVTVGYADGVRRWEPGTVLWYGKGVA